MKLSQNNKFRYEKPVLKELELLVERGLGFGGEPPPEWKVRRDELFEPNLNDILGVKK